MFQQLILIGHLGADPELRYTPENIPVCTFSLAVHKRWSGADGEKKEKATWFRVTAWRRQAEIANQYLSRGKLVMITGEVDEIRAYTNKAGSPAASLEVTANAITLLSNGGDNGKAESTAGAERFDDEAEKTHAINIPF